MSDLPSTIATVYFAGKEYSLGISLDYSSTYFGGPGADQVFEGPRYGPRRLHHLLTIRNLDFGVPGLDFGFKTSFYYGICFEGCALTYRRTAPAAILITEMEPRKSGRDYPYFGYPDVLPYHPLAVQSSQEISRSEIQNDLANTRWAVDISKLYAVIPNPSSMGHALWPPGEDTEIVFEYDPTTGVVRACNQAF